MRVLSNSSGSCCSYLSARAAPVVVGAALAAEARLVAVETERLLVLAEPRHVLAQVPGALGHEVAEVAEDLAAHLLVLVVLGLLEELAQHRIQVAALVLQAQEPVHVVDAAAGVSDLVLGHAAVAARSGRAWSARRGTGRRRERGWPCRAPRQLAAIGLAYCSMIAPGRASSSMSRAMSTRRESCAIRGRCRRAQRVGDALIHAVLQRDSVVLLEGIDAAHLDHHDHEVGVADGLAAVVVAQTLPGSPLSATMRLREGLHAPQLGLGRAHQRELASASAGVAMMSLISVLQKDDAPGADHRNLHRRNPNRHRREDQPPGCACRRRCGCCSRSRV
jgi:hypothetical protein